ncbi:MAG: winged helix-turn-helix transcriptional regulator, partial [Candidatus Sericytochromatia bacterium]|nr:winged helix-turn-helix transcriptional regulator [Candidatus Sericytochromatia bacterium]
HSSKPFNPYIATTFFRTGLIEAWGRGTLKIIDECVKYGNPVPIFKYDYSDFMLEIKANKVLNKPLVSDKNEKTSGKTSGKILDYIAQNPEITIPELASNIGVTERSIERNIQSLQKDNKLKRSGSAKGGKWKVLKG